MSDVKRCSACGKENPVSEMTVCMHHQMHRYVCDSKCMTDFYNPPKKPTAAELAAKVEELEAELAKLTELREVAIKLEQANAGIAQLNGTLRSENALLRARQEPVAWRMWNGKTWRFCYSDAHGKRGWEALYTAPQPSAATSAITMAEVMRAWEYAEDHPHKYLRGTTNWCAAVAHSLNKQRASAQATVQGDGWIPVSQQLPKQNEKVLVTYTNQLGNCRRVIAELVAKHTVEASDDCWGDGADYDEATDQYYCPAGWYECVENWDELAYLAIHEGEVTHWMPLPAAPAIAAAQEGGKG